MLLLGPGQDIRVKPDEDLKSEQEMKFSYQVAWVVARPSKNGHIISLSCSKREDVMLSKTTQKMDFQRKIFEGTYKKSIQTLLYPLSTVCHKPDPGTEITLAYFHLRPYVAMTGGGPGVGKVTGGVDANMAMAFTNMYGLKINWFDAKFSWGAWVKEDQR